MWTFRNKKWLYGEELLTPCPTPKLEDHPFLAVHDCLFNIFTAALHIGGCSSICNLRTHHSMVTGTHSSWDTHVLPWRLKQKVLPKYWHIFINKNIPWKQRLWELCKIWSAHGDFKLQSPGMWCHVPMHTNVQKNLQKVCLNCWYPSAKLHAITFQGTAMLCLRPVNPEY